MWKTGITLAQGVEYLLSGPPDVNRTSALLNSIQTREEKSESPRQQARRSLSSAAENHDRYEASEARMCWLSKSKPADDHDRVTQDLTCSPREMMKVASAIISDQPAFCRPLEHQVFFYDAHLACCTRLSSKSPSSLTRLISQHSLKQCGMAFPKFRNQFCFFRMCKGKSDQFLPTDTNSIFA